MRTNVTFRTHKFSLTEIAASAEPSDQPFGHDCALWLIEQLPRHGITTESEPCQEDWGWELFASVDSSRFWIGVSPLFTDEDPPGWIAHIHSWDLHPLRRFTKQGRAALPRIAEALDQILRSSDEIVDIRWHYEKDVLHGHFDNWAESPTAA